MTRRATRAPTSGLTVGFAVISASEKTIYLSSTSALAGSAGSRCAIFSTLTWDDGGFSDRIIAPIPETPFPWSNRTTTTEQVLARSIEIFGGIDETACATGVSAEYLMMISRERPPNEPLTWDDGGFSDRIIAALVSRLNGIGETAAMLAARPECSAATSASPSTSCIAVAVAHWQDRQRQFGSPTDARLG